MEVTQTMQQQTSSALAPPQTSVQKGTNIKGWTPKYKWLLRNPVRSLYGQNSHDSEVSDVLGTISLGRGFDSGSEMAERGSVLPLDFDTLTSCGHLANSNRQGLVCPILTDKCRSQRGKRPQDPTERARQPAATLWWLGANVGAANLAGQSFPGKQ